MIVIGFVDNVTLMFEFVFKPVLLDVFMAYA